MKIRTRLAYLFLLLTIATLLVFIAFRSNEKRSLVSLFQKTAQEKENTFDNILSLRGSSLATLAFDYTYWDEMVSAVTKDDKVWAKTYISATALSSYKADAVWIYTLDNRFFYSVSVLDNEIIRQIKLPPEAFAWLLRKRFSHFFITTEVGLMEIQAATIHPGNDEKRLTAPQGFFFVGRLWNDSYIRGLSEITGCRLELRPTVEKDKKPLFLDTQAGLISFARNLNSWNNVPISQLNISFVFSQIKDFNQESKYYLFLLFLAIAVLTVIGAYAIIGWIFFPLISISRTLQKEELESIHNLREKKTEFGEIARLIVKFFEQKTELVEEITKRKKLEEMKESLTQMIVHDLNNPLSVVSGYLEVLELQLDASLSEEQKQEFYLALSSAQSVKNMISDLLDISKMEEGKFKLRQEEIRLDAVFKEVEESMKILATQDGKSIIMNAHVGLPAFFGDKEIIKRIISNLIGNALKFTPKGTAIEVNAKFTEDERVIVVSVKDHGQGIPQEYLHRIFEKFVQVESAQVKSRAGKGLGLTFCKMAVEAHQGKIWVESEEGKGSTFYFTLPVI